MYIYIALTNLTPKPEEATSRGSNKWVRHREMVNRWRHPQDDVIVLGLRRQRPLVSTGLVVVVLFHAILIMSSTAANVAAPTSAARPRRAGRGESGRRPRGGAGGDGDERVVVPVGRPRQGVAGGAVDGEAGGPAGGDAGAPSRTAWAAPARWRPQGSRGGP